MRQSAHVVLRPRRSSSARRGPGRWRSPRSAPPRCSPSTRVTIAARRLLADAVTRIGPLGADADWPWPEPRLTYANAVAARGAVAAGELLDRPDVLDDGLTLLRWLLDRETVDGHLSPTPVGGAGPDDRAPAFDQQPIEVAAMADACARALAVDRRRRVATTASSWPPAGSSAPTTPAP